ncbi:DUF3662 and FHA domain-containing protein [Corynebacterium sp. HS2168-gen11]|uniref:DUF3662 and FHA domain-containing protein n=1 Tax=Corynebacterium sp. HS2168-gen11 TaxID=2974027 RepID=UPI00216AEED6|nr:DUF3662 and FHA domain-containing protein [Corynebacterium sp. HS2168-gen11]MCS4535516.1 DUF3662 and FHA domain-containing protein [Corynebacterium sp. HS2168-gen11]
MSFLGKIAKLDSSLQRSMDNGFAAVFGGQVVPAEIEELLKQEIEDNVVRSDTGTVHAPNSFVVRVSPPDFEHISREHPHLGTEFADLLTRYLRNQGWETRGRVTVTFEQEDSMKTGQLRVASAIVPSTKTVTLLLQDGSSRTHVVNEGSTLIGRGNDVDFRLPDTGVSRHHAEIVWNGEDAILVDLQSTNGTTVNDTPIENWLLADGDIITVGHSHIEVRIV